MNLCINLMYLHEFFRAFKHPYHGLIVQKHISPTWLTMKTKNASKVAPRNIFGTEILWTHHQTLKWQVICRKNYNFEKKKNKIFLLFLGQFNWTIAACLLLAWLLVYVCIIKGITENPIIIYITAIYPYVVLIIFLIRALTLPGMGDGIAYLFTPQVQYLNRIDVDILGLKT